MFTGKSDNMIMLEFKKIRAQINNADPLLVTYFDHVAKYNEHIGIKHMALYADSAMDFFAERSRIERYPNEYFKALCLKGDVALKSRQYVSALNCYYLARTVQGISICDNGDLDSKMGIIYFNQRNFLYAGRFWAESGNKLSTCHAEFNRQRLFYLEQGALNNSGVSYEKAGVLDTAKLYFQKDLELIEKTEKEDASDTPDLAAARAVIYDNLGGINLKMGNLVLAKQYLDKCLAIPDRHVDGARIPPLIKLAEFYLKTGNNKKAADAFVQSRALLDRFYRDNPESFVRWHLLYADYLVVPQKVNFNF